MTKDEALKLALEALEWFDTNAKTIHEIQVARPSVLALRQVIAKSEKQEPVACVIDGDLYFHHEIDWEDLAYQGHGIELLYATPPQRKPLTDEEIYLCTNHIDRNARGWANKFARAIEAAHNIKGEA
jgi:hypothetical protein